MQLKITVARHRFITSKLLGRGVAERCKRGDREDSQACGDEEGGPDRLVDDGDEDSMSTWALMQSDRGEEIAVWQTRVSVPLSIIILALIALPIGRVPPRAGRYGRIVVGILFFVVYLNLVRLSGEAIESDLLLPIIGEWWVHIIVLGIAIYLIARESGFGQTPKRGAR